MRSDKTESGQSLSEAVLLSPLFFLMMFAIIQACHLGIAMVLVSYGASSVARLAVQENGYEASSAMPKFQKLMIAGLIFRKLSPMEDNPGDVAQNITITACAELPAYPAVGQFLARALPAGGNTDCGGAKHLGPISLTGQAPYHFILHGEATARMNYKPQG
jgi:hypothetical protein